MVFRAFWWSLVVSGGLWWSPVAFSGLCFAVLASAVGVPGGYWVLTEQPRQHDSINQTAHTYTVHMCVQPNQEGPSA